MLELKFYELVKKPARPITKNFYDITNVEHHLLSNVPELTKINYL